MSETKAALYAALSAHIAELSGGEVITDWALVAAIEDIGTGKTRYWVEGNESQPIHVTVGLLRYGSEHTTFGDNEDEDE